MLCASRTLLAGSSNSKLEKANTINVTRGSPTIKPANSGFLPESQEQKDIMQAEKNTLNIANSIEMAPLNCVLFFRVI